MARSDTKDQVPRETNGFTPKQIRQIIASSPNTFEVRHQKHQVKSLDDLVIIITGSIGIDSKIQNLVKALNFFGASTVSSCEGHDNAPVNTGITSYPVVALWKTGYESERAVELIKPIVEQFNLSSDIKWETRPYMAVFNLQPTESSMTSKLEDMQKSAESLAQFIFAVAVKIKASEEPIELGTGTMNTSGFGFWKKRE